MLQYSYKTIIGEIYITENNGFVTDIGYYPKKAERKETELIKLTIKELSEYFEQKRKTFSIPINPQGTYFQQKVWNEIFKIPYGYRRTYQEIAEAVGNPNAQRAVGFACNKNPVLIVVPCHRVIGCNGNLTGYIGGINIKEKLLALEC